jgi:thioester reductase-like protein
MIVSGTKSLLNFAASTPHSAKMVFCSSIATVTSEATSATQRVPEILPRSESSAAAMGYARSKWVAEHMCNYAYQSSALGEQVVIARIGQLCGDTQYGIWNESEGWPLLIATVKHTGCLPMLDEVSLSGF